MAKIPSATYRLQFNSQFTFQNAIDIVEYLAELNISHIYASPYFQAITGSMHGYDVVDPTKVNSEIGGDEGRQKFCAALAKSQLGQIIDIVPNHMAAKCPENTWWMNVLKYGLISPYADFFDINWQALRGKDANKVLLPVLEDQYEKVLADKKIQFQYNQRTFTISYYNKIFPVSSISLVHVLQELSAYLRLKSLEPLINELINLEKTITSYAQIQVIEQKLIEELQKTKNISDVLDRIVQEINNSVVKLDELLQAQNYRLEFWRISNSVIGYRRFFHINSLVGLHMEKDEVFTAVHSLVAQWFKNDQIDGIRVDHIDGLRDPLEYLVRLHKLIPNTWVVAEKILLGNEIISKEWSIDGTTGYDFMNTVMRLFVDSNNEKSFTDFYTKVIGGKADYYEVLREKKLFVLRSLLGGDVNYLVDLLGQICNQEQRCFDFSTEEIRIAIQELIAYFPVYRTYIRAEQQQINNDDKKIIIDVVNSVKIQTKIKAAIFDFIQAILLLESTGKIESEFVMRFQQLTGPAMAKGEEDTAFYCYNRFVVLNEVGGDPAKFGISLQDFHQTMMGNVVRQPHSMLATSTHDTKRSEDIRARLVLLSEIPDVWFETVRKWISHNEKYHLENVPDRNTQYFLYQNLVGAWPIAADRILSFIKKAVREAKTNTSWYYPDQFYEDKLYNFIHEILADKDFCASLETFVAPLIKFGRINSLSQVAIKLTAPGVPDFYQGTELWNYNFVDPDNRKPVDLQAHYRLFKAMKLLSIDEIMSRMEEGLPKLWLIYNTLELRKKFPDLFNTADYTPVNLIGEQKKHGVAFLRGNKILTFAPRLQMTVKNEWSETYLDMPVGTWRNILTGEIIMNNSHVMVKDIIIKFPVAIFHKEE